MKTSLISTVIKGARLSASMGLALMLTLPSVSGAQAAILFQDDSFHDIVSEGIIINSDDGGDEDVTFQLGNDGSDATFIFDDGTGDLSITTPGGDIDFGDENLSTTGNLDVDGNVLFNNSTQFRLREDADPNTNAECTTLNEIILDTTDDEIQVCTVVGNPGTWVAAAAGDADTLDGVDSTSFLRSDASDNYTTGTLTTDAGTTVDVDGAFDASGSTAFQIREDTDPASNAACAATGEIILDTTDSEIQVCTATGGAGAATWVNVASGSVQDFESVYSADGDNTLTASGTFDIDATGALTFDSDALTTVNGAGVNVTSDGGALALTGDGTADIDVSNAGANIDLDSATVEIDTTAGFSVDGDDASNITVDTDAAAEDLTISVTGATDSSVLISSTGTGADAVGIDATAGGVSIDAAESSNLTVGANDAAAQTLSISSTNAGAGDGDITITADDDIDITATNGALTFDDGTITGTVTLSDSDTDWDADFSGNGIIDNINDIATQLGGDSISTFNFTEANVLADDDTIYAALEKLDLRWGDLASTANGEGASLVGIEDTGGNFTGTTVEDALTELANDIGAEYDQMLFEPEYPNVVIFQDGSDNRGRLDADYDDTNREHFYRWTTRRTTDNDIDLRFRYELPADFNATGDLTLRIFSDTNVVGDNSVAVTVRNDTDNTTCHADPAQAAAAATTWETLTITAAEINAGCTAGAALAAGDIVEIQIKLLADNTSSGAMQVGTIDWDYTK